MRLSLRKSGWTPARFRIVAPGGAATLLALVTLAGSGGCSIHTATQSYPVGRITYQRLQHFRERLDADGVRSAADIYLTRTSKTETGSEKDEQWVSADVYVDRSKNLITLDTPYGGGRTLFG